jgi:hypothetical protein
MVVYAAVARLVAGVGLGFAGEKLVRVLLELPLSLMVPILFFHLLEVPLGRLKRFLPYPYTRAPAAIHKADTAVGASVRASV